MHHDTTNKRFEFFNRHVLIVYPEIKTRTLISWSEKGIISPLEQPVNKGGRRVYSYENLIEIGLTRLLSLKGVPIHTLKALLNNKKLKTALRSNGYRNFFILPFWPVPGYSSQTGKRTQETLQSFHNWIVQEKNKDRIIKLPAGAMDTICIDVEELKIYVDEGLSKI
jgi:DNA-binding transcriptional MerR regulator